MNIEVYSDIVCPWCYIGSFRLDRVLAEEPEPHQVRYHPFFLDPSTPDAGIDIADMLRRKYGVDPRQIWARAESAARESGLALDLSRQRLQYPTLRAHTLMRHAEARRTQRALAKALFEANFVDALDVNDVGVLAALGERHGFARDEVISLLGDTRELAATRAETDAALANGIRGVPFFVFDGRLAVSGAQGELVLKEALRRAKDTAVAP